MAVDLESESEVEVIVDEGELEKLESEVREMAKKIAEYRKTLPEHLRDTLDSALSSSDPLPSSSQRLLTLAAGDTGSEEQEEECEQKMIQLKDIVSRNAANLPKVVKRVRDCVHKLDSFDGRRTIHHPAFTRRRIN
ncbi:hypothetical protein N665_0596s0019 [Sinapis alba]|nr:hypothetical protein N665_0596s0019 [Sinapis alba]